MSRISSIWGIVAYIEFITSLETSLSSQSIVALSITWYGKFIEKMFGYASLVLSYFFIEHYC